MGSDRSCSTFSKHKSRKMYPKFKVKVQEQTSHISPLNDDGMSSSCKVIYDSPPGLRVLFSSGKENRSISPPLIARITRPYTANLKTQPVYVNKGIEKNINQNSENNNKLDVKASPVSRPRAVLSSPDNDKLIGKRNRFDSESSGQKKSNLQPIAVTRTNPDSPTRKAIKINSHINSKQKVHSRDDSSKTQCY
ncbi:hypothetical protein K2173_013720 [Erythroxylum novogranatense]|uniref:Uncharacterized protein n=1 Tax=Erythroxylum novogranatense TaxID=1862640 RepID=A0AAV8SAC4_9ROSI|nr:hypothetical protein K2173_013720 [Erythroxylum novogranatense]